MEISVYDWSSASSAGEARPIPNSKERHLSSFNLAVVVMIALIAIRSPPSPPIFGGKDCQGFRKGVEYMDGMQITYAGGPVVKCPLVYTSFWGPAWSDAIHQAQVAQLDQFHQDILSSNFMNVLTQYGILLVKCNRSGHKKWRTP